MEDKFGLKAAVERGIRLRDIGDKILLENEFIRMWETISGRKITTNEPAGSYVFINEMREVHRLTNKATVTYLSRLIEMKSVTWSAT